jgi:hypothetical protein
MTFAAEAPAPPGRSRNAFRLFTDKRSDAVKTFVDWLSVAP